MTTRRRHVRPAPDDPRLPRKLRQDSGVNLMHEDDWYGFNVASKMPTRGDTDPALNPFTGLPGTILETDSITGVEIAPTSVNTSHLIDDAATSAKIAKNPHGIDPLGSGNKNDDPLRAISGDHVKTETLEGFHFKTGSIGGRAIQIGFGDVGGKLGAHRISGKIPKHNISGVNWDQVDDKPPLATKHYVDNGLDDLWKRALNKFQKK